MSKVKVKLSDKIPWVEKVAPKGKIIGSVVSEETGCPFGLAVMFEGSDRVWQLNGGSYRSTCLIAPFTTPPPSGDGV